MENEENKSFLTSPVTWIVLVLVLLCCCAIALGLVGVSFFSIGSSSTQVPPVFPTLDLSSTQESPQKTPLSCGSTTKPQLDRATVDQIPTDTLTTMEKTIVPVNDLRDLACRLQGKCSVPQTVPSGPYKTGQKTSFWITNTDDAKSSQVNATLQYETDHAYFWVQDNVSYDEGEAKKLIDTFENKIYPTDREFFGSEWTPGIDGDPHIYVLYARGIGGMVAGYFSSVDEYPPAAHKYSNAHEMFVFNADNSPLNDTYTYGVLAHEFQHMIHWNQDRNETSWINEGFSEVAVLLNGYYTGGAASEYTSNPDIQLNDWDTDNSLNGPHYGASMMFLSYFLDRFGKDATQKLVHDQLNGMDSVDDVLKSIEATDSLTKQPIHADDLFMDWAVTNYLQDGSVGDGRYAYKAYTNAPQTHDTNTINCATTLGGKVHQYGVNYIHIQNNAGLTKLHFEGDTETTLLPAEANATSGKYAFWSNKGDESDMTLTHDFDFSSISGPLSFQYKAWYDLEKDYDYTFVEASTDGGKTWTILKTPSGTDSNPSGNSYGWGYNGKSGGWLTEKLDLSQYAKKKVQLRFEYITDAAVNGEGFFLDDVSVAAVKYTTDFEKDDGGWVAAGFARVENVLPQTFRLAWIVKQGGKTTVQMIPVNADQTADISLEGVNDGVLVVSGLTRFTRVQANYFITTK